MGGQGWRAPLARYGAPIAFLAAATAAALLVRAGLKAGNDRPAAPQTVTERAPSGKKAFYRVRPGDTLGVVAERYKTTVDDLIALNPQIDPNALHIGDRIRIH